MPYGQESRFAREFEQSVLRLILFDQDFLPSWRLAVFPDLFTEESDRLVCEAVLSIFDKTKELPTLASLVTEVRRKMPAGIDALQVEEEVRQLYKAGATPDGDYTKERLLEFARNRRMRSAVIAAGPLLDEGLYEKVVDQVVEAFHLKATPEAQSYHYVDEVQRRLEGIGTQILTKTVPTGIRALDKYLSGGGLGPGELGIMVGLPGYHKSTFLVNLGRAARAKGLNVAHATFEISDMKTALRYDSSVALMPVDDLVLSPVQGARRVREWNKIHPGRLVIRWWPNKTCRVSDLEAWLRWLRTREGFVPDLLIADYAGLMHPRSAYKADHTRFIHEEIVSDLRAMLGRMGCPGWTAHQCNRGGYELMRSGQVITMENMAESMEPSRLADVVFTINQSPEDQDAGRVVVYAAKNRDGASRWRVSVRIDPALSLLWDADQPKPIWPIPEVVEPSPPGTLAPEIPPPPPPPPPQAPHHKNGTALPDVQEPFQAPPRLRLGPRPPPR